MLSSTKISLTEYKSESETSIGSALLLYNSTPSQPPTLPPLYNTMSQYDLYAIIQQQQEQLAAMQIQLQALIAGGGVAAGREVEGSNIGSYIKVARPLIFSGEVGKVRGFITACKLYLRIKMKEAPLEEQIQWILSYVYWRRE